MNPPEHDPAKIYHPPIGAAAPSPTSPINRNQGCFALSLWLAPTPFAVASIFVLGYMARSIGSLEITWIAVNLLFLVTAGWYRAILLEKVREATPEQRPLRIFSHTLLFVLLQIVIVPVLLGAVVFAFCSLSGDSFL